VCSIGARCLRCIHCRIIISLSKTSSRKDTYMTPNENMQVSVMRWRSEICTFNRSFAGQRKMTKSLNVFWPE
jgi:hypothetical protein